VREKELNASPLASGSIPFVLRSNLFSLQIVMEALIELCDLIAQNPSQFSEKLSWICGKCPPPEYLSAGSPRVSRSQLNAVLAVSRFLSKCHDSSDLRPKSVVVEFLRAVPHSFTQSFWPHPFNVDSVASFFVDFTGYVSKAAKASLDFAEELTLFAGEVIISAIGEPRSSIARAFLAGVSQNYIPISSSDANRLVTCLIDQFSAHTVAVQCTPRELLIAENASSQSSPISVNHQPLTNYNGSPGNDNTSGSSSSVASKAADDGSTASSRGGVNGPHHVYRSSADLLALNLGLNDGNLGPISSTQQVISFEEESVEFLERQEIAFNLIAHVLENVHIESGLLEQVRLIGKKQIQSLSVFLKVKMCFYNSLFSHYIYCDYVN